MKIEIFNKAEFGSVRVALKDGEPLFCASDACKALGYAGGRNTIARLFGEGVSKWNTPTKSGEQMVTYLTEAQLYKLIMRSHAKNAEAFQDWVCGEVLPTIRKTGKYEMQQTPKIPQDIEEVLEVALELARERKRLLAQVAEDAPKVECYDALMRADGLITIGNFGKLVGVKHIFKRLREMGILMESNLPYAEYLRRGYFEVRESTYSVGDRTKIHLKSMVTPKGQVYLEKRLRGLGEDSAPLLEYF